MTDKIYHDKEYLKVVDNILNTGEERPDRTGTGIIGTFGERMIFDVSKTIPVLTTKKVAFQTALKETLWMFVEGSTNIKSLQEQNVHIWDDWSDSNGNLGPIYGKQARGFQGWREVDGIVQIEEIDQIERVIDSIKNTPFSRRHVITLWNPATAPPDSNDFEKLVSEGYSVLPVCHAVVIQFYVHKDQSLSSQVYIRSNDICIGNPFNLINHSLLLYMVANVCNLKPNKLSIVIGDAHIYLDHVEALKTQLSRDPYPSPSLWVNPEVTNFNNYTLEDFKLLDYEYHPSIKVNRSV